MQKLLLVCIGFAASLSPPVQATFVSNIYMAHAHSLSMGNAVTAEPPGAAAVHFNPAGLALLPESRFEVQSVTGRFDQTIKFEAPKDYQIGGYSDDPVVCNLAADGICTEFKTTTVSDEPASNYLPGIDVTGPIFTSFWMSRKIRGLPKLTLGNGVYAHIFGANELEPSDPRKFLKKNYNVTRVTWFAPSFGFQINKHWSVGGSLGFNAMRLEIGMDLRYPSSIVSNIRRIADNTCHGLPGGLALAGSEALLCGEENNSLLSPFNSLASINARLEQKFFPSFNLGVLWRPLPWFTWGAVYQSEAKIKAEGNANGNLSSSLENLVSSLNEQLPALNELLSLVGIEQLNATGKAKASGEVTWPAHFQTGVKLNVTRYWQVNFDINWDDFSKWDRWEISLDDSSGALSLAALAGNGSFPVTLGYKSVWSWGIGFKHDYSDQLDIRFGFEDRRSVIPKNRRSVNIPIYGTHLYGFGFTYHWDKSLVIDLSLALLKGSGDIPANTNCTLNCVDQGIESYNPYAGLDLSTKIDYKVLGVSFSKRW